MDIIEEFIALAIQTYATAKPYLNSIHHSLSSVQKLLEQILSPYTNSLVQWAYTSPSVLTTCLLILLLFIMLQLFKAVQRMIVFWIRLFFKLTFWAAIVALVAIVWQRGVERTLKEFEAWINEIFSVDWREYEQWYGYRNPPSKGSKFGQRIRKNPYNHGWR